MVSSIATRERHILYVEDNPSDVQLVRAAFAPFEDVHLHIAENGVQAYEFLGRHRRWIDAPSPDLILLDLNLPIISGYDVLRELAGDPAWQRLPIVVLTSSERPRDMDESYRCGVSRYLLKPRHWDQYPLLANEIIAIMDAYPKPY